MVATGVAGCTITDDGEPRALAVTTSTTQPPSTPTSGAAGAVLWFVREGNLLPALRDLPDREPETVLTAQLDGPDGRDRAQELATSIPTGTRLRSLGTRGDTTVIDLSKAFEDVVGTAKQQAIGQLVLTATGSGAAERVRFRVGGEDIQVPSPTRGDTSTVTECDFRSLLPTEASARELGVSTETAALLGLRRAELDRSCGGALAPD